jgi:hypothetical protein
MFRKPQTKLIPFQRSLRLLKISASKAYANYPLMYAVAQTGGQRGRRRKKHRSRTLSGTSRIFLS